ncbi:MAG TPA: peptidyl-prolyl cis-trans isomerase, partial [Solirubrobacteraceae bacterium]|nr:peptidyl-prolyl cis-trans isomerase [Solirubrobacteraceae bacterium]
PDPPTYAKCIANKKATAPKPAKGQPNPTPAQLKSQCQQLYNAARDQVVPFLVTADWLQGEAADQGVKTTDAEVANMLKAIEKQRFSTPALLQQFLNQSGETNADLLYRVRIDTLSNKLRAKVTSAKTPVTQADIQAYYTKNASQFGKPETRDLRLILVKTAADAQHVLALLKTGQSFSKLAQKYSIDQATKTKGGALIGVKNGDEEPALNLAIFGAKLHQQVGPVKTSFGYEIFRVQKITPATMQSVAQASPLITQEIIAQRQSTSLAAFVKKFEAKWKSRTVCASGYVVADCKNAPKTTTTSTTPGATTG